jgi:hypothetical protein
MDPAIAAKLHDAFKQAYDDPFMPALYDRFDFVRRHMNTSDYQSFVPKMAADERMALESLGLTRKD